MSAVLEASGLRLAGRLEETSISLGEGELVCLIGPNGSGKTSLLHAIAGIGSPAGDVRICGVDPKPLGPVRRQRLFSYLPASREIRWPVSARDLVALGLPRDVDEAAVTRALQALDLIELADRRIDKFSTGERSRFLIARTLVARPKLLLLDEPVANLDPLWQLRLMELLRSLARSGQAVLMAVHDLDLARDFADRLIVMADGRIAADGDPQALLGGPCMASVFGIERVDGRWMPVA